MPNYTSIKCRGHHSAERCIDARHLSFNLSFSLWLSNQVSEDPSCPDCCFYTLLGFPNGEKEIWHIHQPFIVFSQAINARLLGLEL